MIIDIVSNLNSFEIASKYNVSRFTLYRILKVNNIPNRLKIKIEREKIAYKKIPEKIKSYIAGIIDGEGYIHVNYSKKNRNYIGGVYIRNTDKRLLEFVVKHLGGKFKLQKASKPTYKDSYVWECFGRKASSICKEILPYLVLKHRHAEILIKFVDTFEDKQHYKLSKEVHNYRRMLARKIKILNKRGK